MTSGRPAYDAVVVGAGVNGLTAAARLVRQGRRVLVLEGAPTLGGSCASDEFGGLVRDTCAAIHPFGAASPAFAALGLADHGLTWTHAPVAVAHPLDDGGAAVLAAPLGEALSRFGADGARYGRTIGALVRRPDAAVDALTGPVLRSPTSLDALAVRALLGPLALAPATTAACALFHEPAHRALWMGLAAHATTRLDRPWSNAPATGLAVVGHLAGWPAARGGSQAITDALAAVVRAGGGEIHSGVTVTSTRDLPPARAVLLDLTPRQVTRIAVDALPTAARRRLERWRYGPGHCKVDYVLSGPMPWTAAVCAEAGTVHVGGSAAEIAAGEATVVAGRPAERPYVLVVQPDRADASRLAPNGHRPLWAYAHTPHGADLDASGAIERQFDRFAPGWRDLVVAREVRTARAAEVHNPNMVGGDLGAGSVAGRQLLARPRLARDPYRLADTNLWMCSGATAPGPGVHGMSGWHAAGHALSA